MIALDRDAREYLELRRGASGMAGHGALDPQRLREEERRLRARYGHGPRMARERLLPAGGGLPRRFVLEPTERQGGTVLYLHGGGWVMGEPEDYLAVCRALAAASGWRVVVPDYAKAPERPFPAGYLECLAVARALADAGEEDPPRLAVAGDSAGGGIAAALAAEFARDSPGRLCAQILITPVLDADLDRDSYLDGERQLSLTRAHMAWFFDQYTAAADRLDPRVCPLRADSFDGLPSTLFVSAGTDVLASEGEAYLQRLAAAGVPIATRDFPGQMHGFFQLRGVMAASQQAVDWIAAALAEAAAPAPRRRGRGRRG